MNDPRFITDPDEYAEWHKQNMARLAEEQRKRMAEWDYLQSDEYKQKVRQDVIDASHAPINPPWED